MQPIYSKRDKFPIQKTLTLNPKPNVETPRLYLVRQVATIIDSLMSPTEKKCVNKFKYRRTNDIEQHDLQYKPGIVLATSIDLDNLLKNVIQKEKIVAKGDSVMSDNGSAQLSLMSSKNVCEENRYHPRCQIFPFRGVYQLHNLFSSISDSRYNLLDRHSDNNGSLQAKPRSV